MGRLVFVGLGLWDQDDMTVRARNVLEQADHVYAEFYTSRLFGCDTVAVAKAIGRAFEILPRAGVEEGEGEILSRLEGDKTVAFMTAGDALTATTHQALRLSALQAGHTVEVVHGVSIKTAASGLLGLSDYKFGRTTTLVFPEERYFPESPLDVILENRARGLHTLVLLDIRSEELRYMTGKEGAEVLLETLRRRAARDEAADPRLFSPDTPVCAVARAGSPTPRLFAGPLHVLADEDLGGPLHCLVVPGRLTEEEAETVTALTGHSFEAERA